MDIDDVLFGNSKFNIIFLLRPLKAVGIILDLRCSLHSCSFCILNADGDDCIKLSFDFKSKVVGDLMML